ncbi:hypothetical protein SAMN05443144_101328 [Fodinibius roseus]|uniref:Uncharacterized protein n=1 Tax=Fodinibius roseus TaxID=1194090 RepID=A0A1M4TM27_9BACT|nr:hypothetical protein [Fodinibius roseus]SHE45434.1 hypothetical protein SAMN05443144_101328 [Fodinibius roseus]
MANYEEAALIKRQYEQKWLAMEEIAAIGIGRAGGETGIIISVTEHPEKVRREIPGRIEGVPIQIKKTGAFNAQ